MKKNLWMVCIFTLVSACSSSSGDGATTADDLAALIAERCNKIFECGVDLKAAAYDFTSEEACVQFFSGNFASIETAPVADPAQCLIESTNGLRCVNSLSCNVFVDYETLDEYAGQCIEFEAPDSCQP